MTNYADQVCKLAAGMILGAVPVYVVFEVCVRLIRKAVDGV